MNRLEQLKQMLVESPGDGFLRYAIACEKEKLGELQEAIDILQKLKADQPEYFGLYYKLGELLESAGKEGLAVEVYKVGIQVCKQQGEFKIQKELEQALWLVED